MIEQTIFLILGFIFLILGYLLGIREKVNLLHSYHYKNLAKKDTRKFCKLSGLGLLFIGIGLLMTGFILINIKSLVSFIPSILGFIIGVGLLVKAGMKYNRPSK